MSKNILILIFSLFILKSTAQTEIPLYSGKIPNSIDGLDTETTTTGNDGRIRKALVVNPNITVFLPNKEKANGTAVVICPGGGYGGLAMSHEGYDIAAEFNKVGVAAFVLKYRLPNDKIMIDKTIGPLQDAQQAIKLVRDNAKEWNIDINKVGIMGFSAGGHLASTAGTHFNISTIENKQNTSLRPSFMILLYPVISFSDSLTHKGSRNNLIGTSPTAENKNLYSNELQITAQTPPTFLVHAGDDKTVKVLNSIYFYQGLLKNSILAEMHIYPKGGHGFGLNNKTTSDLWMERCKNWMATNDWIKL